MILRLRPILLSLLLPGLFALACSDGGKRKRDPGPRPLEVLFLGHASEHHNSAKNLPLLAAALSREGIHFTYTEDPDDLNPENLGWYDALMIYANHDSITPSQEEALLDFVHRGGGFVPLHCASFCFRNSPEYIRLVGGQFQKHDTATFVATITQKDHPVMQALDTFSTWDETYVHHQLTADRTVLMERIDGEHREPWTWVKEYGKGRVFYTAYGHDERTWTQPAFHKLIKNGILWATGDQVKSQWEAWMKTAPQLQYREEANIPNYEKRNPPPRYQEPLSPEESAKLIQVPPQFRLELFASEPDVINPVAMDWDEKGRLWVIETVDYPNTVRNSDGVGDDRIKICEDTDGDGKADRFTVFADNLNIPTSLVFANGGVIVSQAPHFLFLKDTDGDDRADIREVIMDGWGTFDTHAGPSNLKYGYDNRIWGVVGYSGFQGAIKGTHMRFSQGIYRFTPDVSSFEFMTRTTNNTWGLGFTENNDVFASTANNTHSVFMGISDAMASGVEGIPLGSAKIDGHYAMHPVTDKVRQVDVFGGFTAASGHNFYTARAFPEKFRSRAAFVCEPTGHLVHIAWIDREGAGFVERDGWNLFASADEWVAPVEAKTGPDGSVWVLDWYDFIVQHNPTPTPERGGYQAVNGSGNAYENPLRDKDRGRIWRVVHRNAPEYHPISLNSDDPQALVEALSSGNAFWRTTAQRLLVERNSPDVLPELYDLVRRGGNENSVAAVHALWVIDGLHAIRPGSEAFRTIAEALKHPAPGVRKAAIQVLSPVQWTEETVLESGILHDPDANTRLAAILSLRNAPASDALGKALFQLSSEEEIKEDNWLARAVYIAAAHHRTGFMAAYLEANPAFSNQKSETRREATSYDDAAWQKMTLPQSIERAGLDMDGIVWFRKTIRIPASSAGKPATLSLGPIDDSDETYVNGIKVGETKNQYAKPRSYLLSPQILRPGNNVIAIRMEDTGSRGGFYGREEDMYLERAGTKLPLSGEWSYEIEQRYTADRQPLFADVSIGDVFMRHYMDKEGALAAAGATTPKDAPGDMTVIHIRSLENEMKFDRASFTVTAGKPVRVIFRNPDFMQHNLVITRPGAMETVGKAADRLASEPRGAARDYVPDMPEVLFHTRLVNPREEVTLEFVAPQQPGDYPYICTFPGHWSIMNGVMKVVPADTTL